MLLRLVQVYHTCPMTHLCDLLCDACSQTLQACWGSDPPHRGVNILQGTHLCLTERLNNSETLKTAQCCSLSGECREVTQSLGLAYNYSRKLVKKKKKLVKHCDTPHSAVLNKARLNGR